LTGTSSFDHAVSALVLIRDAERAIDAAMRLPSEDRAAVTEQIETVQTRARDVSSALAGAVPGARTVFSAGQNLGSGLADRREVRALGGLVSFFAGQGSHALDAVAGAAGSLGDEPDPTIDLSERIVQRLHEVGVTSRKDLARELEVDPRSAEFRDALERTLGTGRAEWYGSGTYGLPHSELETLIARPREGSDEAVGDEPGGTDGSQEPGATNVQLRTAIDDLRAAVARQVRGGDRS
jgi:hypothetical protein